MYFNKTVLLATLAIALLGSTSCSKDEEEEETKYLTGSMHFNLPAFVAPGDSLKFLAEGVSHPEDKPIGYVWTVAELDIRDTVRTESDPSSITSAFGFVVKDTLITLTVKCSAFAEGYTATTLSKTTIVLDAEKSIKGYDWSKSTGILVDSRDGRSYPYQRIGNTEWFCKNLAYPGLGAAYSGCETAGDVFGRLYSWNEATVACPEGWRLSSEDDWLALANRYLPENDFKKYGQFGSVAGNVMGDMRFNEENELLWEFWPTVKVTNDDNLCLLPFGYASAGHRQSLEYYGFRKFATFWTTDEFNEDQAIYRYIYEDKDIIYSASGYKADFLASVRCVRDVNEE